MAGGPIQEARLSVRIQPGAKGSELVGLADGVLRLRVAAPAREGSANEAMVKLLSELLAVAGMDRDEALRRLAMR